MKIINILIAGIIAIGLYSCDVVDPPYLQSSNGGGGDTSKAVQKVLIEDFTGMKCGNCPEAADLAHEIADIYEGRVIVLGIHTGWYAKPNADFPVDLRCPAANEIDEFFKITAAGNPNGMINRIEKSGSRVIQPSGWAASTAELLQGEPGMTIHIDSAYVNAQNEIRISARIKYLKSGAANHQFCIYIAEDSIIAPQQDDRLPEPIDEDYVHNHVLRGSINGTWGEPLSSMAISAGQEFTKTYTYAIPESVNWDPRHLRLVAFVHDYGETFRILQAEEVHVNY
ncbi:MAG: Omp28 family outer membrane lipoprotein [Candidatus Kapaibacterium sp.]